MECGCAVDVYVDEFADTLTDETRKARKHHKCGECGGDINLGDTYEYYKGAHDGTIFTSKTCLDCLSIRNVFFHNGYYFGQIIESFQEFVSENNGKIAEDCITELTPGAQEHVCSIIGEEWQEYWLNNPTQPSVRLETRLGKLNQWERPGWMHYRLREINRMDNAVIDYTT